MTTYTLLSGLVVLWMFALVLKLNVLIAEDEGEE